MTADGTPKVDGDRLWRSLMALAEIGATPKGGVRRLALTDEDRCARDLFAGWAGAAGCTVSVDRIGNLFARRAGRDESLAPVVSGSHLDSQPTGGKFDGAYGVLAALEAVRALNDAGARTRRPIEIVSWTNEEGARFPPAMMGSAVHAGLLGLDEALAVPEANAVATVAEALAAIGYAGASPVGGRAFHAYFEAHIEQGPILEARGAAIGVVTGIQGIRWFDCEVAGMESHAGTTPMEARRDALAGAARLVAAVDGIARGAAPDGRGTVGAFRIHPDSRNTIPGRAALGIDLRHPEGDRLAAMAGALREAFDALRRDTGLGGSLEEIWHSPPIAFDPACVAAVERAAGALGLPGRRLPSGAGHDAGCMARICPTAMVFIPCRDGISHNEIESATPEHVTAGAEVLLRAIVEKAEEPDRYQPACEATSSVAVRSAPGCATSHFTGSPV